MSLPGRILASKNQGRWTRPDLVEKWGETCDCGRPATVLVQGETDSFGYEANPECQECHQKPTEHVGACDWCSKQPVALDKLPEGAYLVNGQVQQPLLPSRDPDEGLSGPVYYVCRPCRQRQDQQLREELSDAQW